MNAITFLPSADTSEVRFVDQDTVNMSLDCKIDRALDAIKKVIVAGHEIAVSFSAGKLWAI